jgi:hypothetical protein
VPFSDQSGQPKPTETTFQCAIARIWKDDELEHRRFNGEDDQPHQHAEEARQDPPSEEPYDREQGITKELLHL